MTNGTITISLPTTAWGHINNLTCDELGLDHRAVVEQLVLDGLRTVFVPRSAPDQIGPAVNQVDRIAEVEPAHAEVVEGRLAEVIELAGMRERRVSQGGAGRAFAMTDDEFAREQLELWGVEAA